MKPQKPDIFDYTDFRTYLNDAYTSLKSQDNKYSHRFIANYVNASSAGWFSNIISGRIRMTSTYLMRLAKLFHLKNPERDYFELLVNYEQAGSIEEKNIYVDKILSLKGVKPAVISRDQFDFYNYWYISTIRELLFIFDFKDDFKSLAKQLNPPIKVQEAKKAVKILQSLQLIKINSKGYYKPNDPVILKDPNFKTVHWANLMKAKSNLGTEAIEQFDKNERDISEVYVPLSHGGFEEIREEIKTLRKKILALSEKDKNRNTVYQCNIQLFPLTKRTSENEK